jgi:hypothetical protein
VAYASACALWWGLRQVLPLWPDLPRPQFMHPWREVGIVLVAVIGVVLLGQLWLRGIRLPAEGVWTLAVEPINQIIIFAPVLAVPIIRRQGWASAWIRPDRVLARLAIGLALALFTLFLYSALERGAAPWTETLKGVFAPTRSDVAVQVLLEDVAIAILFVRLSAALGTRAAIVGVAALFAAAHIPTMIASGEITRGFPGLLRDFGLGVLVLSTLWRSADVLWLWPVHFALDMTQFLSRAA